MTVRNFLATHNLVAVSANNAETEINTEQTLDAAMLCALGDVINLEPRREDNSNEAIGKEEPDSIYDLGKLAAGVFNFEKAQPQHFAFLLAYALGMCSSAPAGDGYEHTITPIEGDLDGSRSIPSFTVAQRMGKTVLMRRFASCFVDSVTVSLARDAWCRINGNIKGTGKHDNSVISEVIAEAYNADELTLAANAVEGATAAARLANVHRVRALIPNTGIYREMDVVSASDAEPAVIGITPVTPTPIAGLSKAAACVVTHTGHGLDDGDKYTIAGITQNEWSALNGEHTITKLTADTFSIPVDTSEYVADYVPSTDDGTGVCSTVVNFEVLYAPAAAAWMTFPARVDETPLRVSGVTVNMGGGWNGTEFSGGRTMCAEVKQIEWTFNNNLEVQFTPCASGAYAARALRGGRAQKVKIDREFREFIMQQHIDDNDTFGLHILCEGAVYDSPHKYQVEIIFPKVGVLTAPISVDNKRLAESGDLQVLEDSTYGSVIVKVKNLQETYAA